MLWGFVTYTDLALSLRERVGQHLAFNGEIPNTQSLHEALDSVTAKDTEQVVLQGQEISGTARIPLPVFEQQPSQLVNRSDCMPRTLVEFCHQRGRARGFLHAKESLAQDSGMLGDHRGRAPCFPQPKEYIH